MNNLLQHILDKIEESSKEETPKDIFKPYTEEDHLKHLGYVRNSDGTYTIGEFTMDPNKKAKFPILSHRYRRSIYSVKELLTISERATSFRNVVSVLEQKGVRWISFSQLKAFPPEDGNVNSGLQAVGEYKDIMIIFETKVGVSSSSAGYLAWVGSKKDINNACGSTYTKSNAALEAILKKLDMRV